MNTYSDPSTLLLLVLSVGAFGLKLWALVDASIRPAAAFPVAGKLTKPAWVAILAGALVLGLLFGQVLGLFGIAGIVAAIVYLVDVKPAVSGIRPGGPWG